MLATFGVSLMGPLNVRAPLSALVRRCNGNDKLYWVNGRQGKVL